MISAFDFDLPILAPFNIRMFLVVAVFIVDCSVKNDEVDEGRRELLVNSATLMVVESISRHSHKIQYSKLASDPQQSPPSK